MRFSIVFMLFITSFQVAANSAWQWQRGCRVQGSNTECVVWFNQQNKYGQIKVKSNGNLLVLKQQSFVQTKAPSANAILLHLKGTSQSQLLDIKKGLNKLIDNKKVFQKFALYGSGEGLQIFAPLGLDKRQLKSAIANVTLTENVRNPVNDLIEAVSILGSSPINRKVVYWITVGTDLTTTEIAQIKQKMAQEKVRLVILQLALSELSANRYPVLSRLTDVTLGLYVNRQYADWVTSVANLADYSNNGTRLSINTRNLCGSKKLIFGANFSGAEVSTTSTIAYPVCRSSTTGNEAPGEINTEQTSLETADETPESDSSGNIEDSTTGDPAPDVPESATGNSADADSSDVTPDTNIEGDANDEDASDGQSLSIALMAIGGLGLLLLLLLLLVLKNRKKSELVNEEVVKQENAIYGYFIIPDSVDSRRIAITKASSKIGRSEDNDIIFNDDTVSGFHAQLKFERNGEVFLTDLQSSNGTQVNGKEIVQQKLEIGDEIVFGSYQLKFGG